MELRVGWVKDYGEWMHLQIVTSCVQMPMYRHF